MSKEDDYQCYSCFDLGYMKLEDQAIIVHCWCKTGDMNEKDNPLILQAIRGSKYKFVGIKAKEGPESSEEFWKRAERWIELLRKSEEFWAKNSIEKKMPLPYKDN